MNPLFLLAGTGALLVAYRAWRVHLKRNINHRPFTRQIEKLIRAGNQARAIKLCSAVDVPVSRAVRNALERFGEDDDAALLAVARREADREKRFGILLSVVGGINGGLTALRAWLGGLDNDVNAGMIWVGLGLLALAIWTELTDVRIRRGVLEATEATIAELRHRGEG